MRSSQFLRSAGRVRRHRKDIIPNIIYGTYQLLAQREREREHDGSTLTNHLTLLPNQCTQIPEYL